MEPVLGGVISPLRISAREISFEERVEAQRAIEQVYWNHRLWPKENPGKPNLAAVMPDRVIRAKVTDYLQKSNALETWWQRSLLLANSVSRNTRFTD